MVNCRIMESMWNCIHAVYDNSSRSSSALAIAFDKSELLFNSGHARHASAMFLITARASFNTRLVLLLLSFFVFTSGSGGDACVNGSESENGNRSSDGKLLLLLPVKDNCFCGVPSLSLGVQRVGGDGGVGKHGVKIHLRRSFGL